MKKQLSRILALFLTCALLAGTAFAAPGGTKMSPSAVRLRVDGKIVSCAAYDVKAANGYSNTYYKLRDVAALLSGTAKQFDVDWSGADGTIAITTGKPYTAVGGELSQSALPEAQGTLNTSAVLIDGVAASLTAYTANNNNYFKLRELGAALDFSVEWAKGEALVDTGRGYEAADGTITVCLASEPPTMDPTLNSTVDGANMLAHLFEGLMRWNDDGTGKAVLGPGQAASYEKLINADKSATYTFHLKDGIRWSDGEAVTAGDFVYAWRRLADPETAADYSYIINMVKGWDEIQKGGDSAKLAVSAPDERTFVVTLNYDCPFFLETTTHGACMPLRQDVLEQWGDRWTHKPSTYISNGPYRMTGWTHNESITMERSPYYGSAAGPDTIRYALMDDDNAMLAAYRAEELDFINSVPRREIAPLLASGEMQIEDYLGTYFACFNTAKAPFDDPKVRQAFSLVIDRNYIVEQVTQTGQAPADAFVAPGAQDALGYGSDFHASGNAPYWSVNAEDYAANCAKARQLLAEAGYPGGKGFPVVEYIYNTSDNHHAVAQALQVMWNDALGVQVMLRNMDWNVFIEARQSGEYDIARHGWIADYRDSQSFLEMWVTSSGQNDAGYSNRKYDQLVISARADTDPAHRMRSLHAAENLLLEDAAVAPIYFYTNAYLQSPKLTRVYYSPLGIWFFDHAELAP